MPKTHPGLKFVTFGLLKAIALCAMSIEYAAAQTPEAPATAAQQEKTDRPAKNRQPDVDLAQHLSHELILADLKQFREILNTQWIAGRLNGANYDAAITELIKHSTEGMSRADYLVELQKIIALSVDGHAEMTKWVGVLGSFQKDQGFPDFIVDICGDDYIAYRIEHLPEGLVNLRCKYRYQLIRDGFPYISAIDGVPIEQWVETISRFVPKGPELSVRWRCMQWLHYLPFWRDKLGLPQSNSIKVQLTSRDKSEQIELDTPVGEHPLFHFYIPKPDWKIIDDEFGYVWIRNSYDGSTKVILEAMPKLRDTKGLVIDLRGNLGGGSESRTIMGAFLMPPDNPRRVVGSKVQWSGHKRTGYFSADDDRLSEAGRKTVSDYEARFKAHWNPPTHRPIELRHMLLARPEAEPSIRPFDVPQFPREHIYHYAPHVVILMDHRSFSAAEIFLAAFQTLDNVTLVGSPTTSAGGTSSEIFTLEKSGLVVMLGASSSFVRTNGEFIDGKGVQPDIVVAPDVDYYLGDRDRMLETAIEVLKKEIANEQ